tara:strand:+ start:2230 stop:2586 length:357 start_codon:yes stop_codon:yes gene_type:complete
MTKPILPSSTRSSGERKNNAKCGGSPSIKRRNHGKQENSDVLVSAVISTYLLTHLHHVLQRAEFNSIREGRSSQAINFAQLRKVLCMDARSMKDASAFGTRQNDQAKVNNGEIGSKAA